jgi:hypothetical protein
VFASCPVRTNTSSAAPFTVAHAGGTASVRRGPVVHLCLRRERFPDPGGDATPGALIDSYVVAHNGLARTSKVQELKAGVERRVTDYT